jgi:HK97 family phage major capsid protein
VFLLLSKPAFPAKLKIREEKTVSTKVLRQRAAELERKARAILDRADNDGRDLTNAESVEFEQLKAELKITDANLDAEVARMEEECLTMGVNLTPAGGWGSGTGAATPLYNSSRIGKSGSGRRYAEMFPGALSAGKRGFASFDEFLKTVNSGLNDPRLSAAAQGHGEAVPTDGGFFVPEQFSAEMLDVSLESEIVRPRAAVYPMSSATRKIAGFDTLDNSAGAPYGGLNLQWANEGDTGLNKKAKSRLIQLTAQKAMIFSFASNELIADGMSFDEMLGSALVKSLSWGLDNAFLNGDGAGKPKGVLNDPALIVVTKESGQAANTLLYQNVVNMFSRLHPASVPNSVWVANSTCIPQLLRMQSVVRNAADTDNVGGSAVPIVSQVDGKFSMLTRPIVFTEKVPALSSQGDILLADFSQYAIGIRKEISLERSISPGWQTDESAYRTIVRVDGQGKWNKAFTPKNGSTLSWCVTLQAR